MSLQVTVPTVSLSTGVPLLIDTQSPCQWGLVKKSILKTIPSLTRRELVERVMLDAPFSVLDMMRRELDMNLVQYVAIVGYRVGCGKSDQGFRVCKYLYDYVRPNEWSVKDTLVYDIPSFARLVEARTNACAMWDEPQKVLNAVNWPQIPEEFRDFLIEQREQFKVSIVFATPDLQGIYYEVRRLLNYVFEIKARDSDHVHGLFWERRGNPMHSDEFKITGTFTFPKPTDPYLISELEKYHAGAKYKHTFGTGQDFFQEVSHGGRAREWCEEYVQWLHKQRLIKRNPKGNLVKAKKDYVRIWAIRNDKDLTNDQLEQVYGEYCFKFDSGELDSLAVEVKKKSVKRKR